MKTYQSERIHLRKLTVDDVNERYLNWLRDGDVKAFLEVDGNQLTLDDIRDYIVDGPRTGQYFMYAICLNGSNLHIGNVKVGPINQKHRIADLPVVIGDKNYWGKGIAVEAIRLGNQIAFEEHDIRKLHGQIYRDNLGSIKAYCRGGWIIEGLIRGRYLVNGEPMDQVIVSCNNPKYFPSEHDDYTLAHLNEAMQLRKNALS